MKHLAMGLVLGLAVAGALPVAAQQGSTPPDATAPSSEEDEQAAWIQRLDEASARLTTARRNIEQLTDAKGRGAARRYPRGEAKEKYLTDLAAARTELADAEEALPELLEEARRAGVPNGVLDRYESDASDEDDS